MFGAQVVEGGSRRDVSEIKRSTATILVQRGSSVSPLIFGGFTCFLSTTPPSLSCYLCGVLVCVVVGVTAASEGHDRTEPSGWKIRINY